MNQLYKYGDTIKWFIEKEKTLIKNQYDYPALDISENQKTENDEKFVALCLQSIIYYHKHLGDSSKRYFYLELQL